MTMREPCAGRRFGTLLVHNLSRERWVFFFFLVTELNNRCRPAFPGLKLTDEGGECKLSQDVSFKNISGFVAT